MVKFDKKIALTVGKILLSAITVPLWFIKFFKSVGYLPDQYGEIKKITYRYNMLENVRAEQFSFLLYVCIALAILSVAINAMIFKYSNSKKLKIAGTVAFILCVCAFLFSFVLASSVARGY